MVRRFESVHVLTPCSQVHSLLGDVRHMGNLV